MINTQIKLEVGKSYTMLESLGMMEITGEFVGVAKRNFDDYILVFKKKEEKENHYRFFTAKWVHNNHSPEAICSPPIYLQSHLYADSIEEFGRTAKYQLI